MLFRSPATWLDTISLDATGLGVIFLGVNTTRNSQEMFENPDYSYVEMKKQKEIALEELKDLLVVHDLGGTSEKAKKGRIDLLVEIFGSSSQTAIENLKAHEIREGMRKIKEKFNPSISVPTEEEVEKAAKDGAEMF